MHLRVSLQHFGGDSTEPFGTSCWEHSDMEEPDGCNDAAKI
jgi:hypothetical protein